MTTLATSASAGRPRLDDEPLFEIIHGRRVEMPPLSAYSCRVSSRLVSRMNEFAYPRDLGEAVAEVLFALPPPVDKNRRPDVAFVSVGRWPKGKTQSTRVNAWEVVPNLATEVTSPHDLADEIAEKVQEYFRAGVELVWVVYPLLCEVHVYESASASRILNRDEVLDGGRVLPGFQLPLAFLFPDQRLTTDPVSVES